MTLKEGDRIKIDGTPLLVIGSDAGGSGYWLQEEDLNWYHSMFRSQQEINELLRDGRLTFGSVAARKTIGCSHYFEKYVGVREVYDFCRYCGFKLTKPWTQIKDEKEY